MDKTGGPAPLPANRPMCGSRWRHTKTGGWYQIVDVGYIESNLEAAVVYRSLDDRRTWIRPMSEFMDGRFSALSEQQINEAKNIWRRCTVDTHGEPGHLILAHELHYRDAMLAARGEAGNDDI